MAPQFINNLFTKSTGGLKIRIFLSLLVAFLVTAILYASSFLEATGYSFWQLPISFLYIFSLWQAEETLSRSLDRKLPWSRGFIRRLVWQLAASFIISFLILNVPYTFFKLYSLHYLEAAGSRYSIYIFLLINSIGFIFYLLVTSLQLGYTFIKQWQESQMVAGKLRDENNHAKIIGFKQQLNPHFIFNNLNILTVLIDKNPTDAKLFVEKFSESYRYLLKDIGKGLVSLQTEMNFIDSYLYLIQVRFQNSIVISKIIEPHLLPFNLPPFSLQLLIENCVKHNIASRARPLFIRIYSEGNELIVTNNLQPKNQDEKGTNTGLQNIINRYDFFTDEKVTVLKTNSHFIVRIPLLEAHESINY